MTELFLKYLPINSLSTGMPRCRFGSPFLRCADRSIFELADF